MEESIYKHNYEYLSIEEAKAIVNGTFVQGTTNIGGELATKGDIDKLLTTADKKLTSIVPVTDTSNEFICFFECISNETFPDDLEHRWIEVSPIQFTFPADGGSVKITGSYGLTGTLGTRKKVGDIADTITADANATPSIKSGSKTYHYNNDQSQTPTAKVSWTQPNKEEQFPDDKQHRWIEITPTDAGNFTEAGGTITVTGSYGLTGSYGTKKTVGQINDTITVERNTTTQAKSGSKTYYYNNTPGTDPSATVTWTQDAHVENFTYTYEFKIGLSQDEITKNKLTLLFESTQYGDGSKVPVYYKSIKKKINESGQVVETTNVDIRKSKGTTNNSVVEINNGVIYVYPKDENNSLINKRFDNYTFTNDNGNECIIQFIQDIAGIKILSCDAVKFTYKWSNGSDLDQAVYINTNYPGMDNKCYSGYGGHLDFYGDVDQFLKFAGDNTGIGNEYTFIEFAELQKWLQLHKDEKSSIHGKTVIESLTDDNGISSIKVDLYANWYGEIGSNTYIQYTLYNKDGDNQNIDVDKLNKQFILTGYNETYNFQQSFICHSYGMELWRNPYPRKNYTKIGEFVIYLNSNKVSFQSNVDNYNKWQAGVVTQYVTPSSIDYQYSMIDNNDKCNVTVNLKDFTCDKLSDDDEFEINLYGVAIPVNAEEDIDPYLYSNDVGFSKKVLKREFPTSFSFDFDVNTFITEIKGNSYIEDYTGQVYIYIAIQSEKFVKIENSFVMKKEFFLIKGDHITRSV